MMLKKICLLFVFLFLLAPSAISNVGYLPPYKDWKIESHADYFNCTYYSGINLTLDNGFAVLQTYLLSPLKIGMEIHLRIDAKISGETLYSGVKVIIANDTLLNQKISKSENYVFHALNNYKKGEKVEIVLYNVGGNATYHLEPMTFKIQESDIWIGLLLTGVGITVVFAVLGILAVVMYLLKPRKVAEKGKKNVQEKAESKVDEETVAAITAAISAYMHEKKFRIISVKPSPWKHYSRFMRMRRLIR